MMKFYNNETIQGDLILIRTNVPTPPACPVLAQSVKAEPLLIQFIIWLCILLRPACHRVVRYTADNRARLIVLAFLISILTQVIAENLARSYVQRMLGV